MKFFLFLLGSICAAQEFTAIKTTALSSAAEVITIQMPASSAPSRVNFRGAWIDTDTTLTITVERDGTTASTTSLTPLAVNPSASPLAKAWSSSNVGTGTVISKFTCRASSLCSVDLSRVFLLGAGTSKNLTIRTSSGTGNVIIGISWAEVQ